MCVESMSAPSIGRESYGLRLIDSLAFWDSVLESKQLGCVVMIRQLGHGHDDGRSAFEQL